MYVTLEPCNAHGRMPPCVDAVLAAGIARVVAAMRDPNPRKAGGAQGLRAAGIAVEIGLREDEARELNPGFVSRDRARGRPWVRVKVAASLDGRTALVNGTSQWITGAEARADGHAWRARACAILTGIGTVLQDDPRSPCARWRRRASRGAWSSIATAQTPPTARVLAGGRRSS